MRSAAAAFAAAAVLVACGGSDAESPQRGDSPTSAGTTAKPSPRPAERPAEPGEPPASGRAPVTRPRRRLATAGAYAAAAGRACRAVRRRLPAPPRLPEDPEARLALEAQIGRARAAQIQSALAKLEPPPPQRKRVLELMTANVKLLMLYGELARPGADRSGAATRRLARRVEQHERRVRRAARAARATDCVAAIG